MPIVDCGLCGAKLDVPLKKMRSAVTCPACKGPVFAQQPPAPKPPRWLRVTKGLIVTERSANCCDRCSEVASHRFRAIVLVSLAVAVASIGCRGGEQPANTPSAQTSTVVPAASTPAANTSVRERNETYLDDLSEQSFVVNQKVLGKHGATGYDAPDVQKCRLHDAVLAHALSIHPRDTDRGPAYVIYSAGRRFDIFRGSAALNSAVSGDGLEHAKTLAWNGMAASAVTFRVLGDGKLLWESRPLQKHGDSEDCKVAITGVDQLRLEVQCAGKANFAWAFWADPRVLTRDDAPSARPDARVAKAEDSSHGAAVAGRKSEADLSSLIAAIEPAVIRIDVETKRGKAIGSGFVVSRDGVAVTNFHVMDGAQAAKATFSDGNKADIAGAFFMDMDRDVAILKINAPGELKALSLASEPPKKGETVVAVGAPKGLSFSVTDGIVSAVRPGSELGEFGAATKGTWIQTSAPISGGNSGGPLVNKAGAVVGMNTLAFRNAQNVNFAISSVDVREILQKASSMAVASLSEALSAAQKSGGGQSRIAANIAGDSPLSPKAAEFLLNLKKQRDDRLGRMAKQEAAIGERKLSLKTAMLSGDSDSQRMHRNEIRKLRRSIEAIANEPLPITRLNIHQLRTGEVGSLQETIVSVFQVIDNERGECLVQPASGGHVVRLKGVDLSSVVDGDLLSFPKTVVFEVAGTSTYSTRIGTNTVFVLQTIPGVRDVLPPPAFTTATDDAGSQIVEKKVQEQRWRNIGRSAPLRVWKLYQKAAVSGRFIEMGDDDEKVLLELSPNTHARYSWFSLKDFSTADQRWITAEIRRRITRANEEDEAPLNPSDEPELTKAELEQLDRVRAEAEEKKNQKAKEETADRKEKGAAAKLRTAEQFLRDGKPQTYRKTLRELVEKYPGTQAAEKAAKLLK